MTNDFEQEYVHKFYNVKSDKFSNSRIKPWPFTVEFMKNNSREDFIVLDAGCGNGRQFLHRNTIGVDFSENLLLDAARKPYLGLVKTNVLNMPFKDSMFDIVLSIAVIHHLSTHERRLECLLEIKRVLKSKQLCLLYVWHKEAASKKKFKEIENGDYFVSWKGENDVLRYYHLFDEEELEKLCKETGFEVLEISKEQESLYIVLRNN